MLRRKKNASGLSHQPEAYLFPAYVELSCKITLFVDNEKKWVFDSTQSFKYIFKALTVQKSCDGRGEVYLLGESISKTEIFA